MIVTEKTIKRAQHNLNFWLKRWSNYPLAYAIECCGIVPTYQQAKVLNALVKYHFVAVRSGHGIGKSKLIGIITNWYMDTQKRLGKSCRVPITGASYDQLKGIVLPEIISVNDSKWEILRNNYAHTQEVFFEKEDPDGWFAPLRTARVDNPTALQGFHDCLFIIEEAFGVPEPIFEVARGAMGDPGSYGLMVGNPTSTSGYVYNAFHSKTSVWHCLHFSSADSLSDTEYSYPYIDPMGKMQIIKHKGRQTRQWVEDMKAEFGIESNTYKIRVLGEFASGDSDVLIEPRWLQNVMINPEPANNASRKVVMGLDVARSGSDDSALVIRKGNKVLFVESWHGADLVTTRLRAESRYLEYKCDVARIDIIGIGAGVYDEMRLDKRFHVLPVTVTNNAPEDTDAPCSRLRDYLWWKGRKFFRDGNILFSGTGKAVEWEGLKDELTKPTYCFKNGKVVAETKDELKKRGYRSPNRADAFLMTLLDDFELSGFVKTNTKKDRIMTEKRRSENFMVL